MTPGATIEKVCPQCGRTYGMDAVFCPADGASLRRLADGNELVGSVIADRYLITEKLGEGGMGRVYRAQHVRLPQQAAIKVLNPSLVNDPESIARFNREAAAASSISNEHVARVYDFGETGDGLVYLAMEFVPGKTLRALLAERGALPAPEAAELVRQAALGLDAAHRRGIVHRDLKPDNILVMEEADGRQVIKVVDFGIAKALDGGAQVTRAGLVIGTPEYMSPEQVLGGDVGPRSDIYSLGLVAVALLTGALPFVASTPEEAMTMRLMKRPSTLAELRPEVAWTPAVQAVFDRALAVEAKDRFATAGEFSRALDEAVYPAGQAPRVTLQSGSVPALTDTRGEGRADVASAGAPVVVATAPMTAAPMAAAPSTSRPVTRSRMPLIVGGVAIVLVALGTGVYALRGRGAKAPAADTVAATPVTTTPVTTTPTTPDTSRTVATPTPPRPDSQVVRAPDPAPPPTTSKPAPPTPSTADASAALDRIDRALDPNTATPARARSALTTLSSLGPTLRTREDSVHADVLRFQAYALTEQVPRGCALLRRVGEPVPARFAQQVSFYLEQFCK